MEVAFGKASQDLRASIALDEKPLLSYFHAMDIPRYLGSGDEVRELLELSNKVDPDNLIVREKYMTTLEPRWGGSVEQMYAFLDESRKAGLPPAHLQVLEAVILTDRAHGHTDEGDYAAAERDYRKAIALGSEDCLPCFGELLLREGLTDLTAAAGVGDEYSENELGKFNMTGIPGILPPNPDAGVSWFRKAAAQGNSAAMQNLKTALAYRATQNPDGGTASPSR